MSFYGAVLIVAILIVRAVALHRLPKKVFIILWSIALLRLLVPFSVSSEFSLYSFLPVDLIVQKMVPADELSADTQKFPVPSPFVSTDDNAVNITGISTGNKAFIPVHIIFQTLGSLFVSLFFVITYLRCKKEFSTSLPVDNPEVLAWQAAHPLKWDYEIRQSDRISAPLTYGILHPVILLPKNMDCEDEKQRHYVLLHEYTHIRHLDTVTKLLIILAVCLHWFNPLVWILYILFNRDIEFYCDECVLTAEATDSRSSYANTLIHMEETYSLSMPLCNHFSKTAIEERISSIMKAKKTTFGMLLAGACIIIVLSVTLLTSASPVYGKHADSEPFPTPVVTATPTPTPHPLSLPTVSPDSSGVPTATPGISPQTHLTSGKLYDMAVSMFEQFRLTMNEEVFQWEYYPDTYQLTVWKHGDFNIAVYYTFFADGIQHESGVLSLYETDGTWKIAAHVPGMQPE